MKALAYLVLALFVAACLVALLPFTGAGTRLLLSQLDRIDAVSVEYADGSLLRGLQLSRVDVQAGAVSLALRDVELVLDTRCLWETRFCVERLAAASLALEVVATEAEDQAPAPAPSLLETPYPLHVETLELGELAVHWPGGSWQQGALSASLDWQGDTLKLVEPTLVAPVLSLEVTEEPSAEGFEPPPVFLPLALEVSGLAIDAAGFRRGDMALSLAAIAATASWRGSDLAIERLVVDSSDWGRLEAGGAMRFEDDWPLSLAAGIAVSPALPDPRIAGREVTLQLAGSMSALDISAGIAGLPAVVLDANLDVTDAGLAHRAEVAVDWPADADNSSWLPLPMPLAEFGVAPPLQLASSGPLLEPAFRLAARDAGGEERLVLDAQLRMAGQVAIEGDLSANGFRLPATAATTAGELTGVVALAFRLQQAQWTLLADTLDVAGDYNGLPLSLAGSLGIDQSLQPLPGTLTGNLNGATLQMEILGDAAGSWALDAAFDDLGRWLAGARGAGEITATGSLADGDVRLNGRLRGVQQASASVPELALAGSLENETIAVQVTAPELSLPGLELKSLSASLTGTREEHNLRILSQGDVAGELALRGGLATDGWRGELYPTLLQTRSGDWQSASAVALIWQQQTLSVAGHCWEHERFVACLDDARLGSAGDVVLKLEGDTRALNYLLPRNLLVAGPLSASLQARWREDQPLTVAAEGQVTELDVTRRFGDDESLSTRWQRVSLQAGLGAAGVDGQVAVWQDGRQVAGLLLTAPPGRPEALDLNLELDAFPLVSLAPWATELSRIEGTLDGRVALGSDKGKPTATGSLQLVDGQLAVIGNGTELNDLQLDIELNGSDGDLQGQGLLGGGAVELTGRFLTEPGLRLELSVDGRDHLVLIPPASELVASESLRMVVTPGFFDVAGEVRVQRGLLRLETLPEGSVGISSDVVLVDVSGRELDPVRPFDVRTQVILRLDPGFRIEGEGLLAELGGTLQLEQEPGRPLQLFGTLQVLGGELNAYKQRLLISAGTVAFSGPPDNPELNVTATRQIRTDNVTVGARLTGRLEEPALEVFSDPVMPQSEALSYLIRGRGLDSGTGGDGTALALSVGADAVNQSGIVRDLNKLPLISGVAFGASGEENDTAATVSGYVGERLYLSYGVGIYEPINALTARLYLQSRLWLEVVSRLESSIDIYYAFDID